MGSSAVFAAGQIQTHFTRHAAAAARLFHLGCVGWMKNLLSGVVNFFSFFFLPHTTKFFFWEGELSVSRVATSQARFSPPLLSLSLLLLVLCWTFSKIASEASLRPGKGCFFFFFVEDEWLTQLGEYGNVVLMLTQRASRVESRQIYLRSAFNWTSRSQGEFWENRKLHWGKNQTEVKVVVTVGLTFDTLLFTSLRGHSSPHILFTLFCPDRCRWQTREKIQTTGGR